MRFGGYAALGLVLAVVVYAVSQTALRAGVALFAVLELGGLHLAYDPAFASWSPTTWTGRALRRYIYSFYWLRDGGGKRWVRASFGVVGLLFMALVAFGIGWAFWG